MRDIYVTENHPYYQVWVDGNIYDEFAVDGYPLTWSQQWDVAAGYREALGEDDSTHPPCCSSCEGHGGDYSGLCWDCRGTGHAHP